MSLQYNGAGKIDNSWGARTPVQHGAGTQGGGRGVGRRYRFFTWTSAQWSSAHVDVYGQFLETAFACEFAEPVTIEHRRQFMGYQPDLNNNGLPLAREVMRFSFHSPTKQRHALKILKSQGVRWNEMKAFVADNSPLHLRAHQGVRKHRAHDQPQIPAALEISDHSGHSLWWIRLKRHQPVWDWRGKEPSDDLVRNVDDVRQKLEWVELDRERTSKQLTATQRGCYDIGELEYDVGEDSFSRPWRPGANDQHRGVACPRV